MCLHKTYNTICIKSRYVSSTAWLLLTVSVVLGQSFEIKTSLRYPAGDLSSPQPTGLYVDARTGDIYVADAASARIVIYDAQRRFNFEFSTRSRLSSPQQVAVDLQGRIFVLGDTRQHTLAVFDYNGDFLNHLDLMAGGDRVSPVGMALDASDNIYILTAEPAYIHVFDPSGEPVRDFPILLEANEETQNAAVTGTFVIIENEMILPLPIIGQVARMDLDGKLIRIFGIAGGGPTELSFPTVCSRTADGEFVVLDKHRHLLQYFNSAGQYLREVGGAGLVEGWFFHPTALATCLDGVLLVGQMYGHRIQSVVVRSEPIVSGS